MYLLPLTGVVRHSELPEASWSPDPVPACNAKQCEYAWPICQLQLPVGFQKGREYVFEVQYQKMLQGPGWTMGQLHVRTALALDPCVPAWRDNCTSMDESAAFFRLHEG